MYRPYLQRSTTEGSVAFFPPVLRTSRKKAPGLNESFFGFALGPMKAPPPLVVFQTLEKYLAALDQETARQHDDEVRALVGKGLPPVVSVRALSTLFGYRSQFVGAMLAQPSRYYRSFILRSGRKKRRIEAPKVGLKVIQKWIGHYLARAIELPKEVVGFVPKVSAVLGAAEHCEASWVFSTDIEDFFQSTSFEFVSEALQRLGYPKHGADLITGLSTLNRNLSQGSPASPVLSNIAFRPIDEQLIRLCSDLDVTYTRYADDIVISGRGAVPDGLAESVKRIVEVGNWRLSERKTDLVKAPSRLKVYGLLVHGEQPRLTKGYRKRIRAIRHLSATGKIPAERAEEAAGHLSYAKSIEQFVKPDS
jgi:RNA-directed DNA polymerase